MRFCCNSLAAYAWFKLVDWFGILKIGVCKKMNIKRHLAMVTTTVFAGVFGITGCGGGSNGKAEPPAQIVNPVKESHLTTVKLTPKAEERLGIATTKVRLLDVPRTLATGGEIVTLPGQGGTVVAPFTGTVLNSEENRHLLAGSYVKKGQAVMKLLLMPPENDLMSAHEKVTVRQVEYDVARAKAERADQLLSDKAISEKVYEETYAQLTAAKAALSAAQGQYDLLNRTNLDSAAGKLSRLVLESPVDGVIQRIFVAHGQAVPAAAVLFEVAAVNPVWVRVPVYVGDLNRIARDADAVIMPLGPDTAAEACYASPVNGPPLSDAGSASADLYFQVENRDQRFRIGEKVSTVLTLKSAGSDLVIPWSAVLYDMYGDNWVYIRKAPQLYVRSRVSLSHVTDSLAICNRGLSAGDDVVISGAVELFGSEFGGDK
jgi:RND family efflux transporter MFP subunit